LSFEVTFLVYLNSGRGSVLKSFFELLVTHSCNDIYGSTLFVLFFERRSECAECLCCHQLSEERGPWVGIKEFSEAKVLVALNEGEEQVIEEVLIKDDREGRILVGSVVDKG
jgi:hypothetical protein